MPAMAIQHHGGTNPGSAQWEAYDHPHNVGRPSLVEPGRTPVRAGLELTETILRNLRVITLP